MTDREHVVIETPSGEGDLYKGAERQGRVAYQLMIEQEFLFPRAMGKVDRVPGLQRITGNIEILEGERYIELGTEFILHLEDGRKLECFVLDGDEFSGIYSIAPTGKGLTGKEFT
jgi:hypothetical protein